VTGDGSSVPTTLGADREAKKQEVGGHLILMTAQDHRGYISFNRRIGETLTRRDPISRKK
jgi:hypothetical protein